MSIKLIVFDLDGVLIDSRQMHFKTLNLALAEIDPKFVISQAEHLAKFDGHSTTYKLDLLSKERGLDSSLFNEIWKRKQEYTQEVLLRDYKPNKRVISILQALKEDGYILYCASNSIWKTVKNALYATGLLPFIDYFVSNEDVRFHKPSPDIYFKCFERAHVSPKETMICEDSPVGLQAAKSSGACICPIKDVDDLTLDKIRTYISKFEKINAHMDFDTQSVARSINIVIPAAGMGKRFAEKGYSHPKPLIDVNGKPMIQKVVENIAIKGRYIFIVQKEHYDKYNLKYLLNLIAPNCKIIVTEDVTEGAACSVLLAKPFIDNDDPLMIANSDQLLDWNASNFLYACMSEGIDGCISTFTNTHPKFSFALVNDEGYVTEVAEKKPISNIATTGIYFWRHGGDFVRYAENMIIKDIRVNGEFYNCPVYNEAIKDGRKIKTVHCKNFWSIGTPEDLDAYLRSGVDL